ncbi:hypothetical protein [Sphingomonas immobilis]|uniref:Uncharacterized protein n=1 Tax=Sphingomonas immobilis TaxID=3063997 RepID=A0ABT9A465_9SPHN|nr:hypothetical protein [Sphingomonas sp. CA1-15]MDO7844629.1 hypothetical protein [Sphingomonas sp. CA1-15]
MKHNARSGAASMARLRELARERAATPAPVRGPAEQRGAATGDMVRPHPDLNLPALAFSAIVSLILWSLIVELIVAIA